MNRKRVIFGLVLVFLGLLLLGRSMDLFYFTFGELFRVLVPLAFIALGVWLIIRKKRHEESFYAHVHFQQAAEATATAAHKQHDQHTQFSGASGGAKAGVQPEAPQIHAATGAIRYSKFLGDLFVDCNGVNLHNVEVSLGVGDVEIKLHGGKLSPGLNGMVVSGFVGDIRIFAPPTMPLFIHSSNFAGEIEVGGKRTDGVSNTVEFQSDNYGTASAKLYIAASNFIGDIKLFVL
jgi:lia operon protein LiaF